MTTKQKTPIEIATKAFETDYIEDDELQKRVEGFIISRDINKKLLQELTPQIESREMNIADMLRVIAFRSMNGIAAPELKSFYNQLVKETQDLISRHGTAKEEYDKNVKLIESYKTTSDHRKMMAWTIISSLDPVIKKEGFPKWNEKYKDNII